MSDDPRPVVRIALLTPANRGAIGVIRVWGMDALKIADAVFRPLRKGPLSRSAAGRLRLGRVGAGLGDEVVSVVLAGKSEAGGDPRMPTLELQCHGGTAACELVIDTFIEAGATRCNPADWIRELEAYPSRAAARADLARAPTIRPAEILVDQLHGAFDRVVESLIHSLEVDSTAAHGRESFLLDALIRRAALGSRLIRGWRIALAGRPNVGKSSLMNALAGYSRAIVQPTPGTTRDVVTLTLAIDGWPIELSDTAGLRETRESLEALGIERARHVQAGADLVLPVLDRSQELGPGDLELIRHAVDKGAPIIANKSDLPAAWDISDLGAGASQTLEISARNKTGIPALTSAIGRWIVPEPLAPGAAVPIREWQVRLLREANDRLARGDTRGAVSVLSELRNFRASEG